MCCAWINISVIVSYVVRFPAKCQLTAVNCCWWWYVVVWWCLGCMLTSFQQQRGELRACSWWLLLLLRAAASAFIYDKMCVRVVNVAPLNTDNRAVGYTRTMA
ncbi:unnamed protein product [Pylaiella littoralis]